MTSLKPDDSPDTVYEFFAPFAHVPGRYEWCRIRSPTHGVFDVFILLGESTSEPATVYVRCDAGEAFMRDRYPESTTIRVPESDLTVRERDSGRTVEGRLKSVAGPVREARMTLAASADATPEDVPYGGEGRPVWGSKKWTCWGVDLNLPAQATGIVRFRDGREDDVLRDEDALVTLGSFGRIAPLAQ